MASLNNISADVSIPNIDSYLNTLNNYADSAIRSAESVSQSLSTFFPSAASPEVPFESISTLASLGNVAKPEAPSISVGSRNLPTPPNISTPSVSVGSAPTFTATSPSINLPAVPNPLSISAPVKDFTINTSFTYPVEPNTTLPAVPTLLSLNLPVLDTINLPLFTESFPTSNSLVVPGLTFSFTENLYSSSLLTSIKNELLSRVSGGTGLNPVVEQAIWNRGRDREQSASLQADRNALVERSQFGFSRPQGSLQSALDSIAQETQGKIIELSREIMIKQAELEQENVKTSIQQAIALEDVLIKEHAGIVQRAFETAKYIQDIQIEIFKTAVSKYTSEVEAYKAFSVAYTSRVQAELSKVEIFKAKIESEKLKGDINEQNTRIYLAQLQGIQSNVDIYKALISTVSEKIKAEGLKLEVFKADIEAYSETVKAKASEYTIYSEQIKGELAKVDIYDSQVKAFSSRIQAYAAQSDVTIKKAEIESDIQGLNIKKYEADIDAFIKQVQADQLIYQSAVDLYKGETELYLANISANRTNADLSLKNAENIIEQNKYKASISIENAKLSLAALQASYNATLEGKKSAGSVYSQIAGASLSAINVSAGVAGSVQVEASESHNYQNQ
ncbi:chromosome segregation ATPase [Caudoviricetes sp.]|nr:chromosome segregation ATPase [Caudoviricetes sp.]